MEELIKEEGKEIREIVRRIVKRDFSGDSGIAIKNSFFGISTNIIIKIGSILFTIILARLLMPEMFGMYSLALSTIVLFFAFSDMGISTAIVKFLAAESVKKTGKPEKYYHTLLRWKLAITTLISLILIICAKFIAEYYYKKPLFLALIAGSLYIWTSSLTGFFTSVYQSYNDFRKTLLKEVVFQVSRLSLVPLTIIYFMGRGVEETLFSIFIALSIAYFFSLIFLLWKGKRFKKDYLSKTEKKKVFYFTLPLTVTALSGMFFGYIDMIMLGRFVESEIIGYYQAAIALVGSAGAIVGFSGAFLPLYARLSGKRLENFFKKSTKYALILSFCGAVLTWVFASLVVRIIYGVQYLSSITILKILSPLIILDVLIGIYSGFYISREKTKVVSIFLIISTVMNIILNYSFISYGLSISSFGAAIGAAIATLTAKTFHIACLWLYKRKYN